MKLPLVGKESSGIATESSECAQICQGKWWMQAEWRTKEGEEVRVNVLESPSGTRLWILC